MPVLTAANLVRLQREVDVPTAPAARSDVPAKALFVTPESTDFLQAGGLGEVSAALPRALRPGCDARVLLPAYRPALRNVAAIDIVAHLPGAGAIPPCSIGALTLPDGLVVYLVLCSELYDRDGSPYADAAGNEFGDNAIRFARLSLAAAELATRGLNGWRPDVLHLNDWPTALAAGYLRWRGGETPTVLTIHNLAHQGQFDASRLDDLAIPPSAFRLDGVEFYGRISFLKAGIVYADHVTTVCATYAEEIARPEFGCGLNGLLAERANEGRLTGIRNGVDASWDPRADRRNPYRFDAHRWKERYADYVRGAFGLSLSAGPLFAFVARLVHQKGFDLVLEASETIVARGGQIVIVGRGEPEYERATAELARRYPHAVGAHIGFNAEEARAVFAGADFLLMPSRYEPCGLSQMYAQRFGALPIGHRTGGLAETIEGGAPASCSTGSTSRRLTTRSTTPSPCSKPRSNSRRCAARRWPRISAGRNSAARLRRPLSQARRSAPRRGRAEAARPTPRPVAKRAAPRVVDEGFAAAASRSDARALQRLAVAAAASIARRPPRG